MPKIIQNFVVGIRHGGDTCYVTERVVVGAKSPKDAIAFAQAKKGKFHHYSCDHAQYQPAVKLPEGMVKERSYDESPYIEIDGDVYIETDEFRETDGTNHLGEPTLTVERKYVHRYARKATDCLWKTTIVMTGEQSIAIHHQWNRRDTRRRKQLTHHPMKS